jgi:ABC-2 type transport system permease protein
MSGPVGSGAGAATGAATGGGRSRDRSSRDVRASRFGIMAAIVRKDLLEFSRDRLWMVLTPVALVMFVGLYWLLPATVDETITVAVTPPALARALTMSGDAGAGAAGSAGSGGAEGGLRFAVLEREEDVAAAVRGERKVEVDGAEYAATVGLAFPQDFLQRATAGEPSTVRVYLDAAVPPEIRDAMTSAVREMAFAATGATLPVTEPNEDEIVLGVDRAGAQVPMRDRMRPMLAFFVLLVESLALASLIANEIQSRTVTALLATPARPRDILLAKVLLGAALAFVQAMIVLIAMRAFGQGAAVLVAASLLGAAMAAAIAMLSGSAGRGFIGTLFYGMAFLIPLMIPGFALLFPGTTSPWIQLLPSHGVVQAIVGASTYGLGFADLTREFAMAIVWVVALFVVGWWALTRKVRSL